MKTLALVPIALAIALSLAGCGGSDAGGSSEDPLTPEEALDASGEVTVQGVLIAVDGEPVRICSAILESYPPQCGEPSVEVQGLDLDSLDLASTRADEDITPARWSDRPIDVTGTIENGVLVAG